MHLKQKSVRHMRPSACVKSSSLCCCSACSLCFLNLLHRIPNFGEDCRETRLRESLFRQLFPFCKGEAGLEFTQIGKSPYKNTMMKLLLQSFICSVGGALYTKCTVQYCLPPFFKKFNFSLPTVLI